MEELEFENWQSGFPYVPPIKKKVFTFLKAILFLDKVLGLYNCLAL